MALLSTNSRLIKVGQDYSAGSGISIDDKVISVTGSFGKTYSAGDNISIYEQNEQLYISSKDWTNDIANASANAYNEAVAQIPDPFDPTFISAKVDNKLDTTALNSIVDSSTISYNSKPTNNPIYAKENYLTNVNSIDGQNGLLIVPSSILQVPNVITAAPNGILRVTNVITANPGGLTANGITAYDTMSGFSANGISVGKRGPLCIEGQYEVIDAKGGSGFTFSSQNTNFGTAQLTTSYSNQLVKVTAPKFEARNIYGAGFCIEASGAKGYDESGNVVWDTYYPQVKNLISYGDTKTSVGGLSGNIILTVMPSHAQYNISSSPHVIMNASNASYFASYGDSAYTPYVILMPDTITFTNLGGASARATVGCYDIKQEYRGSYWTLTGSIQKRELEYDADTSAITAIAGSALAGGGGVTGEFVPQSAFDELKQSYDALSSLFATYSGQWLLPNEGV